MKIIKGKFQEISFANKNNERNYKLKLLNKIKTNLKSIFEIPCFQMKLNENY